jgi:hypothetical protein
MNTLVDITKSEINQLYFGRGFEPIFSSPHPMNGRYSYHLIKNGIRLCFTWENENPPICEVIDERMRADGIFKILKSKKLLWNDVDEILNFHNIILKESFR